MAASTKPLKKTAIKATTSPQKPARATKKHQAAPLLEAHGRAIDDLHKKLASMQDAHDAKGKEKLKKAVDKVKKAHATFVDDVLFCIPTG